MNINEKDIPFAIDPESMEFYPKKGLNNTNYRFTYSGKPYLLRELKNNSGDYEELGHDPLLVASLFNKAFRITKRYFRDQLLDVYFTVARDRFGEPTVVSVRPFVEGLTLTEIVKKGDGDDRLTCASIQRDFENIVDMALEDPDWQEIPYKYRKYLMLIDTEYDNIVRTPDGNHILIDF